MMSPLQTNKGGKDGRKRLAGKVFGNATLPAGSGKGVGKERARAKRILPEKSTV
jgi:hypothetical protein